MISPSARCRTAPALDYGYRRTDAGNRKRRPSRAMFGTGAPPALCVQPPRAIEGGGGGFVAGPGRAADSDTSARLAAKRRPHGPWPYNRFRHAGSGGGKPGGSGYRRHPRGAFCQQCPAAWCVPRHIKQNQVLVSVRVGNGRLGTAQGQRRTQLDLRRYCPKADWAPCPTTPDWRLAAFREKAMGIGFGPVGDSALCAFGGQTTPQDLENQLQVFFAGLSQGSGFPAPRASSSFKQQSVQPPAHGGCDAVRGDDAQTPLPILHGGDKTLGRCPAARRIQRGPNGR